MSRQEDERHFDYFLFRRMSKLTKESTLSIAQKKTAFKDKKGD